MDQLCFIYFRDDIENNQKKYKKYKYNERNISELVKMTHFQIAQKKLQMKRYYIFQFLMLSVDKIKKKFSDCSAKVQPFHYLQSYKFQFSRKMSFYSSNFLFKLSFENKKMFQLLTSKTSKSNQLALNCILSVKFLVKIQSIDDYELDNMFFCFFLKQIKSKTDNKQHIDMFFEQIRQHKIFSNLLTLFRSIQINNANPNILKQYYHLPHSTYKLLFMKISKLTNRIMFLSPTVQAGWESQSYKFDFENQSILGQGSFGVVWKAKHKKTGGIYAIKQIKKKTLTSQKMIDSVKTEVKIMYCLNHPNIIKLYNHFEDEIAIYFVLEFAQKGELYKTLMKTSTHCFSQQQSARYISQIVHALQYIHKLNIIHRDIKPQNILISKDDQMKLADFGWSNFTQGQIKRDTYCGTLDYLAPQMVDNSHLHDYRVDIWSIGVLIFQLCTGKSPFSSELIKIKNVTEEGIKANILALKYTLPESLSDNCRGLIQKILVIKAEDRLSLEDILAHPWIKQIEQKQIENNEEIYKDKMMNKLKHEFGMIMECKEEQLKKYEAFSNQQIYNYSRIESIINGVPKPRPGEQNDKKFKEHELRIKQLQLCNRRQEDELKYLRNIKNEHVQFGLQLKQLRETNRQQNRKMQIMQSKIDEYQRIIKQLEKGKNR